MSLSTPNLQLGSPLRHVTTIGQHRAALLEKLGIQSAMDLLFFFPRAYEQPAVHVSIASLQPHGTYTVIGEIVELTHRITHSGGSVVGILIQDVTAPVRLVFFNQPFRMKDLARGMRIMATGEPKQTGVWMEMRQPRIVTLGPDDPLPTGKILPIYSLTEGLKQTQLRHMVQTVLEPLADSVPEVLPERLRKALQVMPIAGALREIHQPSDNAALEAARRRFILQEFLVLQLALALRRRELTTDLRAPPLESSAEIDARIVRRFPFRLTSDQEKACREIAADMGRQYPMNRLLQGDVGSGKTVVAQYAMLLAVAHRHQAILMAPTEALARQHHQTLTKSLSASRVRIGLVAGSQTNAERQETLRAASQGEIDILVGTQALLYNPIQFPRLGLVVIDEQHKFGVTQRAMLRGEGLDPHYLVMSATPIPRTLAMTMLADLDVSTLHDKPPGRGALHTYLAKDGWRERWWQFVLQRVAEGRQAYVVAPRIGDAKQQVEDEDSETAVSSVQQLYEELRQGPLQSLRLGLLHGRLPNEDKQAAMDRFVRGETQILVATSVIEVGIDVPNATVMTIFGAEHFGLAQLHQLRGRVMRGSHPGYVCLFTDGNESPDEIERLRVLAETDDGFALAEADFKLRGPGDLMGIRQSGMPPLRIADPFRDHDLCMLARQMALELVDEDPQLASPDLERLRGQVIRRYGQALRLGDVA